MDGKQPYIKQQAEGDNLYERLQKQTLEEIQRLSGKVWTDFNPHDPGVTLADIANYALTEMDYRLGFPLPDYLAEEEKVFEAKRFGLFPPAEVYTTAPVTLEDYRKLFFAHIPELENVWITCNNTTGGYTVKIVLSPFEDRQEETIRQVREVYNSHRNLCEYLEQIIVVQPEKLDFHAELEINPGEDATRILAKVYWTILRYLSGTVRFSTPEEQATTGMSPEEWFNGSEDALRILLPQQQYTEYELYKELCKVKGIRSFITCYLMKDGEPQTIFSEGVSLRIPIRESELSVCIRCGSSEMPINMERFITRLKSLYYTRGRVREKKSGRIVSGWKGIEATYHTIFTQHPIAMDFPLCYNLSPNRETPTSFEAYLKLYDRTLQNGLQEAQELPRLLSIDEKDAHYPSDRDLYALKSRYLDFLDNLYGVESQPKWMEESGCYGETKEDILYRRAGFLRYVAHLTKNRAKARNIQQIEEGENIAVMKEWFCRLFHINRDENRSAGNVLPSHNLVLMETGEKGKRFRDRLTATLINERMLDNDSVEAIQPEVLPEGNKEKLKQYGKLRIELPVFNHNMISAALFRGGIYLDNYRIVHASENEYMLVFRNQEENDWMNLGRTDDKGQLNLLANILRRYLRELNYESETLYIIEPVLADEPRSFTVQLVLPGWTARFRSPRFREVCRDLLRSLLPAHLTGTIYWLDITSMQEFEEYYRLWRIALARRYKEDTKMLQDSIDDLLNAIKEQQALDDTY